MSGFDAARRTVVKVCGLTRVEDARAALDAGADWLGLIVHGESPRRIEPAVAAEIAAALPDATIVAVMVGLGPDDAIDLARAIGARRMQLHRVDPSEWPGALEMPVTFAVPVTGEGRLMGRLPPPEHLVMLDHAHETKAGGTGETIPWDAAAALAARRAVVLAGGLDDRNVGEALERVRPFGVDAASRLEREPGIKDHERVRRFVAAVRSFDARLRAAS